MRKTNKILTTIILISSLLLSIGYSAINNITLDIEGKVVAIPTTRILATGEEFNKLVKGATSSETSNTTITKIVFDYWENGYSDNGTVVFEESEWGKGIPIDVDGLGGIKLFKSDDVKKVYILSETQIYANTDCAEMFYHFETVREIVFNNFDTSKVENMYKLFRRCDLIEVLDVSNFDTKNVINMASMFSGCKKLNKIEGLEILETSNVEYMNSMFAECFVIKSIKLSNFDTSNVNDLNNMFAWCYEVETILFGEKFSTSKVENMSNMFAGCSKLSNFDVSNFDTFTVKNMSGMFSYCVTISELNLSNFDTSKVTTMEKIFYECQKLSVLDLTSFDTRNVTNMSKMFYENFNMTTVYVSDKWTTKSVTTSGEEFYNCTSLVGGAGTVFDSNHIDITYARIDGGPGSETPGYFTFKASN